MFFRVWLENAITDELEGLNNEQDLVQFLNQRKIRYYIPKLLTKIFVVELPDGPYVIDDLSYVYPERAEDWVWEQGYKMQKYLPDNDFNQEFWRSTSPRTILFHGTSEENWAAIQGVGAINPQCKTRGISNRNIGCAVFLSFNRDFCVAHYGEAILAVNAGQMKQDGLMPFVEQEPDIIHKEKLNQLAHAIGLEDFDPQYSNDVDPETLILYGSIPIKYITRT